MNIKNISLKKTDKLNINLEILKGLSQGMSIQEISEDLKLRGISPNSKSIIEKRLLAMRKKLNCKTIFQLMYKIGKNRKV